jgi:hypothetical protein
VLDERLSGGDVVGAGVVLHFRFGMSKLALVVLSSSGWECRSYKAGSAPAMAALELLAMVLGFTVELVHPVVVRAERRVAELCGDSQLKQLIQSIRIFVIAKRCSASTLY